MSEASNRSEDRITPHQLRCDAGTLDEILPGPIASDLRSAANGIERLHAVAMAARTLVRSVTDTGAGFDDCLVPEAAVTELETVLAAAGYDMTDEEFAEAIADDDGDEL